LITAAVTLAYSNTFLVPFIFDDIPDIIEKAFIKTLSLQNSPFPNRPILDFTLAINYALSGLNVWSYHLVNLLIHILAALTLFGIVRRTLSQGLLGERHAPVSIWLALAATLLWALHPIQTQAVTYVIQRCESLMGLFFLLTLYFAIRGWHASKTGIWHALAFLSCLLGVGSKEVMVVAPFLVFIYDITFVHKRIGSGLRQSWGLYLGLLLCIIAQGVLLLAAAPQDATDIFKNTTTGTPSLILSILTQFEIIFHYIRLVFWPDTLSLDYRWPVAMPKGAFFYVAGFLFLMAGSFWALIRRHPLGFLSAWFFGILSVTSILAVIGKITPAFEHRMYLPLAALAVLIVITVYEGGGSLFKRLDSSEGRRHLSAKIIGAAVLTFMAILLGVLTVYRNHDYRSELSIWEDTVQKQPQSYMAQSYLGVALTEAERTREAIPYFREAVKLDPNFEVGWSNLGANLMKLGQFKEAIMALEKAVKINPRYYTAHSNLGAVLFHEGKKEEGLYHFQQAVKFNPNYTDALYNMGEALIKLGRHREALLYFQNALALKPENRALICSKLGEVMLKLGRPQEAIPHLQQALKLQPNYPQAHTNLGTALTALGQIDEAVNHYQKAIQLNPKNAATHFNLGTAMLKLNRREKAIPHFKAALSLKPDLAEAHLNLGLVLVDIGKPQEAIPHLEEALRLKPELTIARKELERIKNHASHESQS
jgi:tetratricopeptide (TPR) repeat protein